MNENGLWHYLVEYAVGRLGVSKLPRMDEVTREMIERLQEDGLQYLIVME